MGMLANTQRALGYFTERTWRTTNTQEVKTSWHSMTKALYSPPEPHGKREHTQFIPRGAPRLWISLCPAPSLCLEASAAACWMLSDAKSCDIIKQCWWYHTWLSSPLFTAQGNLSPPCSGFLATLLPAVTHLSACLISD